MTRLLLETIKYGGSVVTDNKETGLSFVGLINTHKEELPFVEVGLNLSVHGKLVQLQVKL